jgi:hypothetical protein
MFAIGNPEGGNPCLWFIVGGMLDLKFVQDLSPAGKWLLLYPVKIAGDAGLIALPAAIAIRRFGADRENIRLWAKVYCYLVGMLDVFLIFAMLPAVIWGAHGRSLLVTNLLSYTVFGANIILFGNAYRCCFKLSFDRAYYGWFLAAVAVPVCFIAIFFALVP